MEDEAVVRFLSTLAARSVMHRHVLVEIVRSLARDVPDFDVEGFQERLYGIVERHPHTPATGQSGLETAGRDELSELIAMVEKVIPETRED